MDSPTHHAAVARHPEHDAVAEELRSWYVQSTPEIGIEVAGHWFGFVSNADGPPVPRVILTVDDGEAVRAALGDAAAVTGADELTVVVDDRARHARLGAALRDVGCVPVRAVVHLAYVGGFPDGPWPDGLALEEVDEERLGSWVAVKLKCFDDREDDPTPERFDREVAIRRRELPLAALRLATLHGEPVGVLGYYPGPDQVTFNLGTRLPYRHRAIGRSMLRWWVDRGVSEGCRSLMINADDPGRPQQLYRSLGFTDEVYWYARYTWRPTSG